jgi:hypothetical protein
MNNEHINSIMGSVITFSFLQYLEEKRRIGDKKVLEVYEQFYKDEYPNIDNKRASKHPILYFEITLMFLFLYVSKAKELLNSNIERYEIEYTKNGEIECITSTL